MPRYTCAYIKRDGTACGNKCYDPLGCYRHWKLYEKNMKKFHCLGCGFPTDGGSGFCSKYCSKYSAKFHSHNYRMRQKRKAETGALQLAKTSELSDETLQPIETFELSDVTLQPAKTYELSDGEESDGLDLFG